MAETICIHARREQRRLATAVRQAALHATVPERVQLRALIGAVGNGNTTVQDARSAVAHLRRDQNLRRAA